MTDRARARRIRMILTDVDGTLTDGTLAVLPDGEEIKSYHVKDGLGVLLAQMAGLEAGHHHRQALARAWRSGPSG